ncbi:hypothetical protein FUAX_20400 [Fulvitalea axinellae]|uniref:Protein kinase domain-containing protein n=2 Tax=Fulvitalea axinellae TaxID=1182444 RepID=A0AAU9D122_9BACT|nr:hypothetical protein FUAX_20400 [Fulvitalea axinellae]
MLTKAAYLTLLDGQKGGQTKSKHETNIAGLLEHYAFLVEETQRILEEERRGYASVPIEPTGLRDNCYRRIRVLHDIEQAVFLWKRSRPVAFREIDLMDTDNDFGINTHLLEEVQKERAAVTAIFRTYSIELTPSLKYGLKSVVDSVDQMGLSVAMGATKRGSSFPQLYTPGVERATSEAMKNRLISDLGQLLAFPTGAEILTEFMRCSQQHMSNPTFRLASNLPGWKGNPGGNPDTKNDTITLDPNWSPADYFVPVASPGASPGSFFKKSYSDKNPKLVTYTTPYLILAANLATFTYTLVGKRKSKVKSLVHEKISKLRMEMGLEEVGAPELLKRETGFIDIELEGDRITTGQAVDDLTERLRHLEEETRTSTPEEDDSSSDSSGSDRVKRKMRVTSHGIRRPAANFFEKEQATMEELQPSLDFNPDDIDFTTFRLLGEQGAYGSVYGFTTKKGKECILKFVNTETGYNFSFSWHPEKEAFASNFVRALGSRVDAPACLALRREGPELTRLAQIATRCSSSQTKQKFYHDLKKIRKGTYDYTCLVMERAPGVTRNQMRTQFGNAKGDALLARVVSKPFYQASVGELFVYDLLLGNFDRFWLTVHGGNAIFNVKTVGNIYSHPAYTPREGKPMHAIDQTLSAYGQYIFLRRLKDGKSHEALQSDPEYKEVGRDIENAETRPLAFQSRIRWQVDYLRTMFKKILDNLMAGKLGRSMESHFLQDLVGHFSDYTALEIGMVQAMLQIRYNREKLGAFEKVQFPSFSQEAFYLFECCRMVDSLVDQYDRIELFTKLSEMKAKLSGPIDRPE